MDSLPNFIRTLIQNFSLNELTEKLSNFFRTLIQSSNLNNIIYRYKMFDIFLTQQINIFSPLNKTYNFSEGNSLAWNNTILESPPGLLTSPGETEINYTKIETSDNDRATDIGDNPYHKFNMSIDETNFNHVDVLWEGYNSVGGNISLYVWNYTKGNWSLLNYGSGVTDFNLTARISDLNNVQGGKNITFLVQDG